MSSELGSCSWAGFSDTEYILANSIVRSVGFGITGSTSYIAPYQLVRSWSTLDHLTEGRIGMLSCP
jgi:alkanesulfonate monooxygenase SsuD/methylene tetrahydromethanopterin reductase-like flavin-dependent oxidoreductase (luciferase family)